MLVRAVARVVALLAAVFWVGSFASAQNNTKAIEHFERSVRPVFARNCVSCHAGAKPAAGIALDKGISKATASQVFAAVGGTGKVPMPPSGPLPAGEIDSIRQWVQAGAPWPAPVAAKGREASSHWAFAPLQIRPAAPLGAGVNRLDHWLTNGTRSQVGSKASPRPTADRRTLLRRLSYTLTGLPPTPAETAAFLADNRPGAYERQVDRLLASPRYGEKWGRKWLDIVRYADTAGENSDHPVPDAWRYRNWVIDAFNRNIPYDTFVRLQIAGDLIRSASAPALYAEGVVATGYLAIARRFGHEIEQDHHLTLEDTIDTLGKSVLGLTVGCARCHDHKFDPVSQRDYYALYGIFDSTRYAFPGCEPQQQPRDLVPLVSAKDRAAREGQTTERLREFDRQTSPRLEKLARAEAQVRDSIANPDRKLGEGMVPDAASRPLVAGSPAKPIVLRRGDSLLLVVGPNSNHGADTTQVRLRIAETSGSRRVWNTDSLIDALPGRQPVATANGASWAFVDLQNTPMALSERLESIDNRPELVGWRNGETPSVFANRSDKPVKVWTELPARSLFVHPGQAGPVGLSWTAPDDTSVVVEGDISDAHPFGDGISWTLVLVPAGDAGSPVVALAESMGVRAELQRERSKLAAAPFETAYAVVEGKPHDARLHRKGDPADLGDTVPRGWLSALGGGTLADPKSSGRAELASWIFTNAKPLAARVWANRIWAGLFGRGIVATPNDFGTRGMPPTDRRLLDSLADHLIRSGWDTKALHRLILTSSTWKAVAADTPDPHRPAPLRRRLEAEEIRDTLLLVTGELDATPGGAHPFPPTSTWSFSQHAPFAAEYDTLRRSVYVMQKRNRSIPFFALFDGADPNTSTAVRDETNVPTQALWFLNNPFAIERSRMLGRRIASSAEASRIETLWFAVLGRKPDSAERQRVSGHLDNIRHLPEPERWASVARILFASNEFLYVD